MAGTQKTRQQPDFIRGGVGKRNTAEGPCWFLRYRHTVDGKGQRTRIPLGLVSSLPTRAHAERAALIVRAKLAEDAGKISYGSRTLNSVIARYREEEMPELRHSTQRGYAAILDNHVLPVWGHIPLADIQASEVRNWIRGLDYSGRYRGHIHDTMTRLFKVAMLWGWYPRGENPMKLFSIRGASKRQKQPQVLTIQQFATLLEVVTYPYYRAMIVVSMCLGVRCSELTALRWKSIDVLKERVHIQRGIVEGREADVKTVHSSKSLPLHPLLADELLRLREWSEFKQDNDFVFASPWLGGELPFRSGNVQAKVLVPAGEKIGLGFRLGWHAFRHSYKTLLDERGVSLTVQRDLMRHADIRTTAQVYGDVALERLREANADLVGDIFRGGKPQ